jgi:uncharacterized protein YtpQ (UPF0354 family)
MGILFWRGRTSKRHFRDRFIATVRELRPLVEIRVTGDLEIELVEPDSGKRMDIWLGRAYKEFERDPKKADEIIRRHLGFVEDGQAPSSASTLLDAIVPMIKDRSWVESQRSATAKISPGAPFDMWIEDYNAELVVAYAEFRTSLWFVTRKDVAASGKSYDELRVIALENLRRRTHQRTVHGDRQPYLVAVGGNLEASVILDDHLWTSGLVEVAGGLLIGIPDRDSLLVTGVTEPDDVFRLASAVDSLYRSEPYPITDQLFARSADRFQPLDPSAIDDQHPIPNLDVIDVHVIKKGGGSTLAVIVASPLSRDPRSVYRLFRKLNGYLTYIASPEHVRASGPPTPASTEIEVSIHPDSAPEVIDLLESLQPWVESRKASLHIKPLPP